MRNQVVSPEAWLQARLELLAAAARAAAAFAGISVAHDLFLSCDKALLQY